MTMRITALAVLALSLAASLAIQTPSALADDATFAQAQLQQAASFGDDVGDALLDLPSDERGLLDIMAAGGAGASELQASREQIQRWRNWKPDDPLVLTGEAPDTDEVRRAIKHGVDYVLDEQNENGSWDVTLTGTILSNTADDAVDAVTITSMCGIALRSHVAYDREKIQLALRRGAEFVMDRVIRGKLSKTVIYAIWRYSFGLRFLMGEYRAASEGLYKEQLAMVCRRMVQAVLSMQNSNDDRPRMDRMRESRVRGDAENPSTTGVVVALPTDEDYRGGAKVIELLPWSPAIEEGLEVGDRIVRAQRLIVENAYDFYNVEAGFLEGMQNIVIEYRKADAKPDADPRKMIIDIPLRRPGYLALRVENHADGVRVAGFYPGSPGRGELQVGDVITEIEREKVSNVEEYIQQELKLEVDRKIRLDIVRGAPGERKKNKSVRLKSIIRPDGRLPFQPNDEDKGDENGVDVLRTFLRDGRIQVGDRITHINEYEILGHDHFVAFAQTLFAGQKVTFKVVRLTPEEEPAKDESKEGKDESEEGKDSEKKEGEKEDEEEEKGDTKASGDGDEEGGEGNESESTEGEEIGPPKQEEEEEVKMKREEFTIELVLDPTYKPGSLELTAKTSRYGRGFAVEVIDVKRKGAAAQAGIRKGDYLMKLNGRNLQFQENLAAMLSRLAATSTVTITVERSGQQFDVEVVLAEREGINYIEEGGWAYYKNGYAPSFVIGAVILNLMEVEETFDDEFMEVPGATIRAATRALENLRVPDPNDPRVKSYVYDIRGRNAPAWRDIRGNIGRIMVGELALHSQRKVSSGDLTFAMEVFLERRHELDRVRTYPHTHYQRRWNNAAYYWLFGHYYAAQAAHDVRGKTAELAQKTILEALMLKREEDGLWLGHEGFGKLCATAHALMIFGELPGDFRTPPEKRDRTTDGGRKKDEAAKK